MAWTKVGYGDILRDGTYGDPVCDVQRFLYILKLSQTDVSIDGYYGAATRDAVKFYQEFGNAGTVVLEVDGQVGPQTWAAMKQGPGGLTTPDNKGAKLTKYGC